MTLLDRLDTLMAREGINRSQLAIRTGIPKTTIYGWYDRGYENMTLPSLRKLSEFFGCTMEYLANGPDLFDVSWGMPILSAYQRANADIQNATCAVLGIDHVRPIRSHESAEHPFEVVDAETAREAKTDMRAIIEKERAKKKARDS